MIAAVLSTGKSSRFYENLVRKGLALFARADYSVLSRDTSLFQVFARPQPGTDLDVLQSALEQEFDALASTEVKQRALEQAKNKLEAHCIYGQDSLFMQAMMLAHYEMVSDWRDIKKYIPSIRAVTAPGIQQAARKEFGKENRTVGRLVPDSREAGEGGGKD